MRVIAWLAVCVCAVVAAPAAHADLIVNGDFEQPDVPSGGFAVFSVSIPGWAVTFGSGIEVQDNAAGSAFLNDQLVELDSFSNSGMAQTIATVASQQYSLSFAFSARPGEPASSNGIDVFWGGVFLVNVTANGIGLADTSWAVQNFTVTASGVSTVLEFRATGTSNRLGGYLDAVTLNAVPVTEPSLLVLLGVGSFVVVLRRRTRARGVAS